MAWARLCLSPPAYGQDAIHAQFMFDDLYVNPGLTGINDYHKFSAGVRDQWPELDHAFVSFCASYDQQIPDLHSGVGLQVFGEVDGGRYSRTSAGLFYSYRFNLSKRVVLSPGVQLSVAQRAIRTSGLTLPDDHPFSGGGASELLYDRSSLFPDFGCGIAANVTDRYSAGVAVHHLNRPVETISEINGKRTPISLSVHFISYFPIRYGKFDQNKWVVSPGFYFRRQQYQNIFSLGSNIAYDPVFVGVWSRSASKIIPESIIFLLGMEQNFFRLVYSYDSKLLYGNGNFSGTGAHELTLVWKIHPKKRMQTIKCSKYSFKI
jgi:type IX secretion system PorP/SprF family membrane protein